MIAQSWGMVGITADIFGDDESILSTETLAGRMDAALGAVSAMENVDSSMIAAFSYGTPTALMYALNGLGTDTLKAIVSFHADLSTNFLPEELQAVGPKLLVLSGGADDTPAEIMGLEVTLDTANATWEITRYSDAGPSFTVFENDNYNQLADMRSWQSSFEFIKEAFGITTFESAEPDGFDSVTAVDYNDTDGTALRGWLAMPNSTGPSPAVVILPDWDGVNEYEKERAVALAELGYLAFAADIYGADKQFVESTEDRVAEVGFYSTNPDIYFSRIQTAIEQVKMMNDGVLSEDIALIGYCFGGSGVVLYSIRGGADAKVSVAFHGSFNVFNVTAATVSPYLLVLSGGDDGLHGNQTIMEAAFNEGDADWEITRYSGVGHGYTVFGGGAYDLGADARSWDSMLKYFYTNLAMPGTEAPTTAPAVPESPTTAPAGGGDTDAAIRVVGAFTAFLACFSALFVLV